MTTNPLIRNWRSPNPYIGHDNAIVWAILSQHSVENDAPTACMERHSGFARHAVQGGKKSDCHQHDNAEQYYYILSGRGEVLVGDKRHPVRAGSVTYFPPKTQHQFFSAEENAWCEHLIITCPSDREGSQPHVFNWRDVTPTAGVHGAAVTWPLLQSMDESNEERPCLLGSYYLAQQALVRGKAADNHVHDDKDQLYYILEGVGTMLIDEDPHQVAEGDIVHLPRNVWHQIINEDYDGWLSYLVIS